MANANHLFTEFNKEMQVIATKESELINSRDNLRTKKKDYFAIHHKDYKLEFWIQWSYKMGTTIRTKDDTCDMDDGVYFTSNPQNVSCTKLQSWVKRDSNTGQFLDIKTSSNKPFKGVRKEK